MIDYSPRAFLKKAQHVWSRALSGVHGLRGRKTESSAFGFAPAVPDAVQTQSFLRSLQDLTQDDISAELPAAKRKRLRPAEIVRYSLLAVCSVTFCISFFWILRSLYYYQQGDQIYSDLEQTLNSLVQENSSGTRKLRAVSPSAGMSDLFTAFQSDGNGSEIISSGNNAEVEAMRTKINYLKGINSDSVGWITINNTQINYAFVQGTDNAYYLSNSINNKYLPQGTIFMDYHNSRNLSENRNTVLYGHNMTNGSMFHDVERYLNESFFRNNPYIKLATMDGIYTYKVFAIYEANMYYRYFGTFFESDTDFLRFAEEMRSNSLFKQEGITFNASSKILTLSTCTNGYHTQRYALQAVLVSIEQ